MRRLFGVAFLADFQLYLIYTALPFKALQLGAGPFELGAIAALSTGSYAILASIFGRLSDRLPRMQLARVSCVGFIVACIGFTLAPDLRVLYLFAPFAGGSMAPFWPSVQAAVADYARTGTLERQLGRFNLSWSSGKAVGFLVGGSLVAASGSAATFTLGSFVAFTIFILLPRGAVAKHASPGPLATDPPLGGDANAPAAGVPVAAGVPHAGESVVAGFDPRAVVFRRLAWVANGVAFGVSATLNHHYPRLVQEFGWGANTFGVFLGLTYFTQTLTFLVLAMRPERWCFRRTPLYAAQVLLLAAVLGLPFAGLPRVVVSALVIGASLGTCYYSSIVYSLHTDERRGRNAGVHEGLIGLGSMFVPFLGGVGARVLDALWVPYAVAAFAVAGALLFEEIVYALWRRAGSRAAA